MDGSQEGWLSDKCGREKVDDFVRTWSHTKSLRRVELVSKGLFGTAYFLCTTTCMCRVVEGKVFLRSKMVYTFERMTSNRATTCVEFAFSELVREMFFVTMEYVNGKVSIFFTAAT